MLGIDIASYQEQLNLQTAKNAGVQAVIIKATQGNNYKNPCLKTHVDQAKNLGLNFGLYHYYDKKNGTAEQQAEYFCNAIKGLGYNIIPMLDFEESSVGDKVNNIHKFINYCKAKLGVEIGLYTGANFASTYLDSSCYQYKLWVAYYASMNNPIKDYGYKTKYPLINNYNVCGYQYASCYRVNGYNGNLDVDEFYDNIFIGSANVTSSTPATPSTSISPHDYLGTDHKRKFLQYCLNALGYNLVIDGIIGNNSIAAIKDYQSKHGLTVDGLVGKNTWSSIKANMPTCRRGSINNAVKCIQYLLSCSIDGNYGAKTEAAVRAFQQRGNGTMAVDGVVGQVTWGGLFGFCFV